MFGEEFKDSDSFCDFCAIDTEYYPHIPQCPLNFIQPDNYYNILEQQFIDEETDIEEASYQVGKQVFLAIDAVLNSQKKWAQKSLMQKFDEVLNRYTDLTNFVVALRDCNVFTDIDILIEFLLEPSEYGDVFAIWIEFGQPQKEDDTWQDFVSALQSCGWKKAKS
jgi:hypothetical protein